MKESRRIVHAIAFAKRFDERRPWAALARGATCCTRSRLAPWMSGAWILCSALGIGCQDDKGQPKDVLAGEAKVIGAVPEVHSLGATATARDYSLRALNVRDCTVEPHLAPPQGIKRVGVEVEIRGSSPREVPVNPFYATLIAGTGERYEASLAGCRPLLPAGRVSDGQTLRGWLSFDVPSSLLRFNLSYEPVVLGVGREEVRFDLGG